MTCYLRLHEVAVAVHDDPDQSTDWDEVIRRWRGADGADGRDAALEAMPVDLIEMDDLPTADLRGVAGLVLAGRSDQQQLAGMRDRIGTLLDRGGAVVFSGQLTHDWLPGTVRFERRATTDVDGPPVLADHPIFDGVDPAELAGSFLYRDGWHRPPDDAEVIAWRADGTPGAYIAEAAAGRVLVHGGANLLANGSTRGTATRIVPQLVEWLARR